MRWPLTVPIPRGNSDNGDDDDGSGDPNVNTATKTRVKTQRPRMHKVLLLNDDYTPREFVVLVLRAVFGLGDEQAYRVMMAAHQLGTAVVAVYARDIAETKASEATELARKEGHPLQFTTEPEE
ncbi:MAG: ATP-dependent Clp protease adaptor ClpS [Alphaproteobacteria bacterium]|nr:ATP-dependent Clp protease adaptor ClpS [Alphaproteobacteria bacterium]